MTTTEADGPERIYLEPECDPIGGDRMWCEDKIEDDWIEYVRADRFAALEAENERLRASVDELRGWCNHHEERAEKLREAARPFFEGADEYTGSIASMLIRVVDEKDELGGEIVREKFKDLHRALTSEQGE